MSDTLARLEAERSYLADLLREHQASQRRAFYLSAGITAAVSGLLIMAILAGQLSWQFPLWAVVIGGVGWYFLTRGFRYSGYVITVFDILTLLTGTDFAPEEDVDAVRQRLVECESQISALRKEHLL